MGCCPLNYLRPNNEARLRNAFDEDDEGELAFSILGGRGTRGYMHVCPFVICEGVLAAHAYIYVEEVRRCFDGAKMN